MNKNNTQITNSCYINTPLGSMFAVADERDLLLLDFTDSKKIEKNISSLEQVGFSISPGSCAPLRLIEAELNDYFKGHLTEFKCSFKLFGTSFQKHVWHTLLKIPYGESRSYAQQAQAIGKANAYRAVANANGSNKLAIIIPCHRIIASDGTLGGYASGVEKKRHLLAHERH